MKTLKAISILLFLPMLANCQTKSEKVVEYCLVNMGRVVGDGVCITLVNKALYRADKKWYRNIDTVKTGDIFAGDVVEFFDCRYSDGSLFTDSAKGHVAIVSSYDRETNRLTIYEQNVSGVVGVAEEEVDLSDIVGRITFLRLRE